MIICISGPSNTGKSELINTLRENIRNIFPFNSQDIIVKSEVVREYHKVFNNSVTLDEILSEPSEAMKFQIGISRDMFNRITEIDNDDTIYICDRGPLDTLVYLIMSYSFAPSSVMSTFSNEFSSCCSLLRVASLSVDRYFFTTPDSDSHTADEFNYHRNLEIELFNLMSFNNDKVKMLPSNEMLRREMVYMEISDKLKTLKR